jgi:Family of unknown function (DUF6335)
MAKSKSARKSAKRGAAKRSAKKATRRRSVKSPKSARKVAKAKAKAVKRGAKAGPAKKSAKKVAAKKAPAKTKAKASAKRTPRATAAKAAPRRAPTLDRDRRTVRDAERSPSLPSSLDLDRSASSARTGRAEFVERLHEHTSTGPALTGGDVDADWESAETVGDEAPGGDNPTPDQDVVDEIGHALGIEYDDDEELRGGEEIVERDKKRWELDPASSDDFDER